LGDYYFLRFGNRERDSFLSWISPAILSVLSGGPDAANGKRQGSINQFKDDSKEITKEGCGKNQPKRTA
jgi:hypothetical protein